MRDMHAEAPARGRLRLRSVGISGIRKPLVVQRSERQVTLAVTFRVSVDLPSDKKGSDLSRDAEVLAEVVDATVTQPVDGLESACSAIAGELLARHRYATVASVEGSAEYFLQRGIAEERRSFEDYLLLAEAVATRDADGKVRLHRAVGAEAVGMTACPCAMETCRAELIREYPLLGRPELESLPMITHNQRNRTRLVFELEDSGEVEVDQVIETIEAAQSSPTYAILKRGDEGEVVLRAHRRPKFVEDVLRDLLASVPERFPALSDATVVRASTQSEESIHKYNVEASHRIPLRELRHPVAQ